MPQRPDKRPDFPPRNSDNDKRRLDPDPDPASIANLVDKSKYEGSSKHKRNPHLFGLDPYRGKRGDETLCDEHAGFDVLAMARIPELLIRGIVAGLVGGRVLWTIDDDGWIYEMRLTNADLYQYHGYPVRPTEAIARPVYDRFAKWASSNKAAIEIKAANACAARYGFD